MNIDPYIRRLKKNKYKKYIYWLTFVIIFDYILFPLPILAKEKPEAIKTLNFAQFQAFKSDEADEAKVSTSTPLSKIEQKKQPPAPTIIDHGYHPMTAYNSEAAQTDSDPCTTANGFNVCEHGVEDTVAANFLKFGTKIRIPELFGDRVFVVRDRMNRRYPDRVDVWFVNKKDALKFGVKYARIEVLK